MEDGSRKHEPIGVSGTNSEAEGGGEVKPEAFPEFSGNGSDGHLVNEEGEDDEGGFAQTECVVSRSVRAGL